MNLAPRSLASLFGFGAVFLTVCDGFHTYSGTTSYPAPLALQAAWWVPLNFGLGVLLGGIAYAVLYRLFGGTKPAASFTRLAPGLVAFGALYYFSGFYKGPDDRATNEVKLAVLATAAVALHALLDRTLAGVACSLVTALVGPTVEVIFVHLGYFKHLQPDVLGVPMWLPALYACSGPVIGQGARRVLENVHQREHGEARDGQA